MSDFQPRNADFAARVRDSFMRQRFMATLGAEMTRAEVGEVEIHLPHREELTQQHGRFHGGVIGTLADNAAAYAAFTLMGAEDSVLTVEYKMNIVSPGVGNALVVVGKVLKPGRRLTASESRVYAVTPEGRKLCAVALATIMTMENMPDDKPA